MKGGGLDEVRQGLRLSAPPDPAQLAAERAQLAALAAAPWPRRWAGYLRLIGPGYLQSAMTLGSGTAASCLFAGAVFGYELLWVAPLGMLLGVLVMGVVSHLTLSTGARPLPAMATYAGRWLAAAWAIAAVLASIVWHFPQYNLAAAALVDAAEVFGWHDAPPLLASGFVLAWAVWLSLAYGKNARLVRIYERCLKYAVWGIVVALLVVVVRTPTDWGAALCGLVPSLPPPQHGISSISVAVAGLGAAVGINMLLLYPYSLLARGWGREHRGLARFDLFAGMFVPYGLATGLLVLAAANTLHARSVPVTAGAAVSTLAAVLGDAVGPIGGRLLFDLGMVAMALSTITLHMVVCGFVAMEWFGLPFGSRRQRLCTLIPVPGALAPVLWPGNPVWLAVPTSILSGAMLPIAYLGFLGLLRSRRFLAAADRPRGPWLSLVLVLAMGVLITALVFYLRSLW
ncbi:MAG: divalent metal cation transporter [Planctomycetes bacterium]|nr:divalent metal cation transporter [Planctomycetota bacterium]